MIKMSNKVLSTILVGFWGFPIVALAQFPSDRVLTDSAGRKLEATVLSHVDENIRIRRKSDGKEFDLPMDRLSQGDRDWLIGLGKDSKKPALIPKSERNTNASPDPTVKKPPVSPLTPVPLPPKVPFIFPGAEIVAKQKAQGLVLPPDGRNALQTSINFTDGRIISGYVYDIIGEKFWYAGMDMIQKEAAVVELAPHCRIAIENWRSPSRSSPSPSMEFVIDGKIVHASVLHADKDQVKFFTESGEILENVPVDRLDEMGRRFLAAWSAGTWRPDKWEWALPPGYDAAKPYFDNGHALVNKDGKWGLIDLSGKLIQQPRFDMIRKIPDSPNLKVSENDKWGLMLDGGKLAVPPTWEDVGDMHFGMIPVCLKGKWGYAKEGGELVIPCTWDSVWRFSPVGTAVVTMKGKRGYIDRSGKVIVKPEWDGAITHAPEGIAAVRRGNGWALVARSGEVLCEPNWVFDWTERRFELGYIPAWPVSQLGTQHFTTWWTNGRKSLGDRTFLGINGHPGAVPKLREGVCLPGSPERSAHPWSATQTCKRALPFPRQIEGKPKQGLSDLTGRIIFKPEYDAVALIDSHTVLLNNGRRGQIAHLDGKVILEENIKYAAPLKNGSGFEVWIDGKMIIYWNNWNPVLPPEQQALQYVDSYGQDLIFREGDKDSSKGWWYADFETRKLRRFEGTSRIYWVKSLADHERIWLQDEKTKWWHFCSIDGTRLGLEMAEQPSAWFFDEGFGKMWENDKCYFVNRNGKRLDFGLWDDADVFKNGLVAVKRNGLWGFINTSGKMVIECNYDEVGNFFVASSEKNATGPLLAGVRKSGKWGYVNEKGSLIIPHVGDQQGGWNQRGIYLYSKEDGGSYYRANGEKVNTNEYDSRDGNHHENRFAGKWSIESGANGLVELVNNSGQRTLKGDWIAMEWVAPGVVAVRGQYTAGLYSIDKGWLFQDNGSRRIMRDHLGERLDLSLQRHGLLKIESTPKWGYARWSNATPDKGLVAYYALNGDTQDSSGMKNHASGNQVQWTADKNGNANSAIFLDGPEGYVECPIDVTNPSVTQVTFVAWARCDKIGKWSHLLGVMQNRSIELMSGWSARGTGGQWGCFGHRKIEVGEWVFLAVSYDNVTKEVTLRVNDSIFKGGMSNYRHDGAFKMGGGGAMAAFEGAIDEVRVYNRLLSEVEIGGLYQQFLTGKKN